MCAFLACFTLFLASLDAMFLRNLATENLRKIRKSYWTAFAHSLMAQPQGRANRCLLDNPTEEFSSLARKHGYEAKHIACLALLESVAIKNNEVFIAEYLPAQKN
jgi:hypothetical protein